ncbi:hypothetical protein UCRNP2_9139 [Neofusicoccum parvum UCRNP2]|uniref:Uncharacterized protein n=1 Tax=Botryosphaeria parva (strain UCR-NP2) TaxID=1287680 RepID=R1GDZ5_BOTPV|nr:hypothetical protein UCRNP2_9139 [Neofusicoccum parvum UCRNP2]
MTSHPSSAATINVTSSAPCSAPATPTTDNVTEWHAHYARWISRFWKRILQEAKDLNIIPKTYRGHVHARTISSTDVSNPVIALCHYLASPSLPSQL